MRYSGSRLRPRWPRVACWVRRRTWSTTTLASRMAWKWSTTTVACPSGPSSALAYPRQGSNATLATPASQSRGRARSQPSTAALVRSATTSSSRPPSKSTSPVTYRVGARRVAFRKLVSSSPSAATPSSRVGSSSSGRPWSATARMMVAQPTPRSRATAATAWASLPTRRQASARARWVSTARGAIAAARSVQVRTRQAGSRQRQRRLRQHSTTGWPPIGRSRTPTVRRPWAWARTPQPGQPTTAAVVWITSRHSPPTISAARTSKPSRPSSLEADALPCWPTWGLLLADVRHPQAMRGPRCCSGGSYVAVSSTPPHASWRRARLVCLDLGEDLGHGDRSGQQVDSAWA
jgi:hypothetical protein